MLDFFQTELFFIGERSVNIAQLIWMILFLLSWAIVFKLFSTENIKELYARYEVDKRQQKKLRWILGLLLGLTSVILLSWLFKFDAEITLYKDKSLTVLHIIKALCVVQAARLFDWTISNIFIHGYYTNREKLKEQRIAQRKAKNINSEEKGTSSVVQYIVYLLVIIVLIRSLNLDYEFFDYSYKDGTTIPFKLTKIFVVILILLVARLIVSLTTQIILYRIYLNKSIDEGSQYAINQLLKYVIYVAAIIYSLESLGINMTLILGGAAALLVGIGLGLQQTFNDFISGIVLLFERSISVGDAVMIDSQLGVVKNIGMRSSVVETRENTTVVVPNSKLVNEIVDNWSHFNPIVRFSVSIGVAYGSDTILVKNLLLEAANNTSRILRIPKSFVRFTDFGDSALSFKLFFYTRDHLYNDDIKSDLRFEIDRLFREQKISIPFPQRDIWIRSESD